MPLLAMIYPRGKKIKDEYDVKFIKHAARLGAEIGADVVKVSYTGSTETFSKVVKGCRVPVVIAGGPKMDTDLEILEMVKGAMDAGASGISIGRNVFQHKKPALIINALSKIVHEDFSIDAAMKILKDGGC
jgi:fructose-bisphosphate aldolase, class I